MVTSGTRVGTIVSIVPPNDLIKNEIEVRYCMKTPLGASETICMWVNSSNVIEVIKSITYLDKMGEI